MSDTKICPNCGKEILAVAQKCKYCKAWIIPKHEFRCPICREIVPEDSEICPVCHERIKNGFGDAEQLTGEIEQTLPKKRQTAKWSKPIRIWLICTLGLQLLALIIYAIVNYFSSRALSDTEPDSNKEEIVQTCRYDKTMSGYLYDARNIDNKCYPIELFITVSGGNKETTIGGYYRYTNQPREKTIGISGYLRQGFVELHTDDGTETFRLALDGRLEEIDELAGKWVRSNDKPLTLSVILNSSPDDINYDLQERVTELCGLLSRYGLKPKSKLLSLNYLSPAFLNALNRAFSNTLNNDTDLSDYYVQTQNGFPLFFPEYITQTSDTTFKIYLKTTIINKDGGIQKGELAFLYFVNNNGNWVIDGFDYSGEAIAGYSDEGRSTIYEYSFSGQLYNSTESHNIVLTYVLFPVDDDDDGWFDVSGDYRYPEWQKDRSFSLEGMTNMEKLVLYTENSEIFDLVKFDDGFVLKGDWYKYKSNQDRERDKGLWTKHLKVQLKVDKDYPLD